MGATASSAKKRGRVENLRPWAKGQSGNPSGRPKGAKGIKRRLLEALESGHLDELLRIGKARRHKDQAKVLVWMAEEIIGKPRQPISGDDDAAPIRVEDAREALARRIARLAERNGSRGDSVESLGG